jgi:Cu/Ag efflux protein CusF
MYAARATFDYIKAVGHELYWLKENGMFVMKRNITFAVSAMFAIVAVALAIHVAADEAPPARQLFIYSGILRAVDLQARTVTVDGSAIPQQFIVATDAEIIVKDKPRGALGDLAVSDGVQVKYTDDDGAHVAHQISLLSLKAP